MYTNGQENQKAIEQLQIQVAAIMQSRMPQQQDTCVYKFNKASTNWTTTKATKQASQVIKTVTMILLWTVQSKSTYMQQCIDI